ncbi:MAG: hypothetical protein P1U68_18465 [Verrucomicrobiales bacterium]|nr:hypothetical protein [Verrucomicrobiales bacterium]MDF2378175.1 hypothetical protein [Verrucomicrobiales bacterium]
MIDEEEDFVTSGYWPSVTDLFITLFVIAIAILAVVSFVLLPKNDIVAEERAILVAVGLDLRSITKPANDLREELDLEEIRETQSASQIVVALEETCMAAVDKLRELKQRIEKLKDADKAREELAKLQDKYSFLEQRNQELEKLLAEFESKDLSSILTQNRELRSQLIEAEKKRGEAERKLHDKPPIIRIDEQKEEYRFTSGSSTIEEEFSEGLRSNEFVRLAGEIIARQDADRVKVDTLEIIGHTDGVPVKEGGGNLDDKLPSVLAGESSLSSMEPGSNNDLGLLRALAVKQEWESYVEKHDQKAILKQLSVRCYSAGQTILPEAVDEPDRSSFLKKDPKARRIEMRLTRLSEQGPK